ncbi:MAG: GTP-binding protein, partial [Verrucomicrobiota bacterium]
LRDQLKGIVTLDDIVVVQSQRVSHSRTLVLPDGSEVEETVEVGSNIDQLAARILAVVKEDGLEKKPETDKQIVNLASEIAKPEIHPVDHNDIKTQAEPITSKDCDPLPSDKITLPDLSEVKGDFTASPPSGATNPAIVSTGLPPDKVPPTATDVIVIETTGKVETENLAPRPDGGQNRPVDTKTKLQARQLEIAAFGTISSGKSALLNALAGREVFTSDPCGGTTVRRGEVPWPNDDKITLIDTPGLAEVNNAEHEKIALETARSAEIVLFVIDGALKSFEHDVLTKLSKLSKRVILCLNKADWISESNQVILLDQLRDQLKGIVTLDDIVVVQSQRVFHSRTLVQPDGSEVEETVEVGPNIDQLATRILDVVKKDGRDLLLNNLLLRAHALTDEARNRVRAHLDKRAAEVVDSHAWQAGTAAALMPTPVLDLAASSVVLVKMTYELAQVYGQSITFDAAAKLFREVGKSLVGVIGTAAILPTVASTLKSVPGVGTITGGVLQGLVQALIARWAGAVMTEHFRNGMNPREGSMAELARVKWEEVTQPTALAALIKAGLTHIPTSRTTN